MTAFQIKPKKVGNTVFVPKRELVLPTEDCVPETNMLAYSFFIYGKQGIGKTTFSLQFPDTLHLMFEPGAKSKAFRKIEPRNWSEVESYVDLLETDNVYKTVVIDTVDEMWDMCVRHLCKEKGVEYLKDIGFGDGWSLAGSLFKRLLIRLHACKGLVILAHEKERKEEGQKGPGYIIPSTQKTGAEVVAKWVDFTGHYYIDISGKRYIRMRTNAIAEAKCRPDEFFNYTDGSPVENISMGNSAKEAYVNFEKGFNNKLNKKPLTIKKEKKND